MTFKIIKTLSLKISKHDANDDDDDVDDDDDTHELTK